MASSKVASKKCRRQLAECFWPPVADSPDFSFLFSTPDVVSTFLPEDGLCAVFIFFLVNAVL